jgi:hypothetical protein
VSELPAISVGTAGLMLSRRDLEAHQPPVPRSATFAGGHRFSRARTIPEYTEWVMDLERRGFHEASGRSDYLAGATEFERSMERCGRSGTYLTDRPSIDKQAWCHSRDVRLEDAIMVGMRLREGIDVQATVRTALGERPEAVVDVRLLT